MDLNSGFLLKHLNEPLHLRPMPAEMVTFKECGNITEIIYSQKRHRVGLIKKLDKNTYVDTRDGEVKVFKHHDNRLDDTKSVRRSLSDGRDMINANIVDPRKWLMITLTYAENMTDPKKLYNDFKNFWHKKFCVAYPTAYKYIQAVEPQGRGAWHCHLLAGFSDIPPFISNDVVRDMWGHGFVKVKKMNNVDNVGAYLSAYLADLPIDDAERLNLVKEGKIIDADTLDDDGKTIKKKFVKGARMSLYPSGMHIFRWSRNCDKPKRSRILSVHANRKVEGQTLVFENTTVFEKETDGFSNIVNKRCYNKLRKEAKSDNN